MAILKTGDRFLVDVKDRHFVAEFIGLDLSDIGATGCGNRGTGCQYIILRNTNTDEQLAVEHAWFNEMLTGRKITTFEDMKGG